jgi:hypothetical protein
MNTWILKDKIKRGYITFDIGDEVICFHRKSNGYPKAIEDDITYIVKNIDSDGHIYVSKHSSDGIGWLQPIRVHKIYMIPKYVLRDIKLNSLLDETN